MTLSSRPCILAALALACIPLQAQSQDAGSRIEQVLLFPGGAQVERLQRVPAGAAQARFACLSEHLERDSLQVQAGPGVALGELQILQLPREQLPECQRRDPRLRELEAQRAAAEAELGGLDLALGALKGWSSTEPRGAVAGLPALLESVRRQGQEALVRQQGVKQRIEDLDRQLRALRDEGERAEGQVSVVQLRLSAPQGTELRLSYRVRQAGWQPQYRAHLDSAAAQLQLERLAEIAQSSGEDWSEVRLRLSTVQPRQAVSPGALAPWRLDLRDPRSEAAPAYAMAAAPAPAAALAKVEVTGSRVFEPAVFVGEFATEYELAGRVSLRGNGRPLVVALGRVQPAVTLASRVLPQRDARAYLVAELARPEGSWPAGPLQLYRDGSLVGQSRLQFSGDAVQDLFFGVDERLRVRVEPEQREGADTGFVGSRREQRLRRAWVVENLRDKPIALQVLEAAPVAQHDDIKLQRRFSPTPSQANWREQPGLQLWSLQLAPRQSQRFEADYTVSSPKDAVMSGWR